MLTQIFGIVGLRFDRMAFADPERADEGSSGRQDWTVRSIPPVVLPSMTVRWALVVIFALTLWRVVTLSFDSTDLFVDEAQYWLWSRDVDLGYYSKPPMIAWVIRAMTELSGSTDIFWIRVCGPIFHCATSLVLMRAAARLFDKDVAVWTGVTYVTLPGVALSSVFFSTDVILLFFLAIALDAYLALTEKRSVPMAIALGLSVAAAFLSKYAILFLVPGGLIAIISLAKARLAWRDFLLSAAIAIAGSLPNLWWNLNNRMVTVRHTENIAHWNQLNPRPLAGLEFFAAQFGVVGPVVFAAILFALYQAAKRRCDWRQQLLLWLTAPVIVLICLQATIAKAYANWAVTAYVAGTLLAVSTLRAVWPQGLRWSLLVNGAVACLVALLPVFAHQLSAAGAATFMNRYVGRSQVSTDAARLARDQSLMVIVSDNRDILADMFYTLRGQGFDLYARLRTVEPQSYYEQMFPVPRDLTRAVLFVSTRPNVCNSGRQTLLTTWQPVTGNYHGKSIYAYRMDPSCLGMP